VGTGKRLWRIVRAGPREFGVPTPIVVGQHLLVSSENQGTRIYRFAKGGAIDPQPVAVNQDLAPDSHTPVVVGNRVFGVWNDLFCLDLKMGLKTIWRGEHNAFATYASLIASDDRLLVTSISGELLLIDAKSDRLRILSESRVFEDDHGVYSHPALVGSRLYLRGSAEIVCLDLLAE